MPVDRSPDTPRLQPFTLGDWLVDPRACQLSRGDAGVKVRAQLVDVLTCLARRAGEIVLKDEILQEVWPGQFIAESGLSRCIAELRQILQDDAQQPRYIETITKRGYRLVAPVVWVTPAVQETAAEEPAIAQRDAIAQREASAATTRGEAGAATAQRETNAPPAAVVPAKRRTRTAIAVAAAVVVIAAIGVAVVLPRRLARSVLTDQDTLVLCFENHTGDTLFNGALQLALAVHLEQSPFLRVISDEHVRQTLRLMGKDPDAPFERRLAAEVCEREGARAMVVGSIARLGDRYVLGVEAVACGTGDSLARRQVQVNGKDAVLDGLGEIGTEMRQALGESLASIEHYAVPIARATTASLEALRAASLGDLEWRRGRGEAAIARYAEATTLDPSFALAYARQSSPLLMLGLAARSDQVLARAYELRDRTSLPERLEIEGRYHQIVTDDYGKSIEAVETLKRTYPRLPWARRFLASTYALVGRFDEALAEAREGERLEPDGGPEWTVLAQAYMHLNRFDEAKKVATETIAKKIDSVVAHSLLFDCAFAAGDRPVMEREVAWAAGDPEGELVFAEFRAEAAAYAGKLREAGTLVRRVQALADERRDQEMWALARLMEANYEALYGRAAAATALVRELLARPISSKARQEAAIPLAFAGQIEQAETLLREAEGKPELQGDSRRHRRLIVLAMIETQRGHPDRAIALLEALRPRDLGTDYDFLPVIARGQAYLRAGNGAAAVAEFEKVPAHNGLDPSSEMTATARLGIARGHALAGNAAASRAAYDAVLAQLRDADADLPFLAIVRRERAQLR